MNLRTSHSVADRTQMPLTGIDVRIFRQWLQSQHVELPRTAEAAV